MTKNPRIHPPRRPYVCHSPNYMRETDGTTPLKNSPFVRVVIHATVSPCVPGGRVAVIQDNFCARTFKSSHLVADPEGVSRALPDWKVAESAPPNQGELAIELCDSQDESNPSRWFDTNHSLMLHHAGLVVARWCLAYQIPTVRIMPPDLSTHKGICGHVDVSNQFHQTTHTDPGPNFPWSSFIKIVKEQAYRIQNSSA